MSNVKISALPAGTLPLAGTEAVPIVQGATTVQVPASALGPATINIATGVTGVLAITNGGTGQATANVALNALLPSQPTHSGQFLTTNGTDSSWAQVSLTAGVSGVLPVANGGTGQSSPSIVEINSQTGTTYTLLLTDAGKCVEMNNASANTLTVPPNSVAFPVGTTLLVRMMGAGQTSIAAGGGVTIHTPLTLNLFAQYSLASLHKRATNEWCLDGGLLAP